MDTKLLRTDLCAIILRRHEDPALWLLALRRVAEDLELDPSRCIPIGVTLELAVSAVLEEAVKRSRSEAQIRAAFAGALR